MPKDKELSLLEQHFKYQEQYTHKYGKRTIVMMEVGKFFEAYATDEVGFDLAELSELIGVVRTKKNCVDSKIDEKHPYMLGFPSPSLLDKLQIMTDDGINVIVIKQLGTGHEPKREIAGVYTAGINVISYSADNSNIVGIYVKEDKTLYTKPIVSIGMVACDVTVGRVCVHEAYSTEQDDKFCFDEVSRFLQTYPPKELLLHVVSNKYNVDSLKSYWGLSAYNLHVVDELNPHMTKLPYQTELFHKLYPEHGLVHPIEYIGMAQTPYSLTCFVMLLEYIYTVNSTVMKNIEVPVIFDDIKMLYIGNDANKQLNVFSNGDVGTKKIKCLYDIVNHTSTPMGKRFLINKLNAPLINLNALKRYYNITEYLVVNNLVGDFREILHGISDVEKYYRKMTLGVVRTDEFFSLIQSIETGCRLIESVIKQPKLVKFFSDLDDKPKMIKKMIKFIRHLFDVDKLKAYNIDTRTRIYHQGVHDDLDILYSCMTNKMSFMEELKIALSNIIGGGNKLTIKKTPRDGYYFCTTRKRGDELEGKIKKMQNLDVGQKQISVSQISFSRPSTNITRINIPEITNHSDDIVKLEFEVADKTNIHFIQDVNIIVQNYGMLLESLASFIAEFDYVVSNAKTSQLYNYTKPIIKDESYGYVECQKIRHPIIERIIEHEYIPHDITIGKPDFKGMLLYGLNSSGKSSMMKALGISIIMAQAGMFVPAKSFIYSPYKSIMTRISGNDNLFKELSSFGVEMVELKAIWNRADKKTLVIGDEVCRGTEHVSGNAIVATTILKLVDVDATFIFATHLHDIIKLKRIKELTTVKAFHLTVEHDHVTDELIFDRQLKEGSGPEVYGITVAKYLIQNSDFIKTANEIKDELLGYKDQLQQTTTSKYNNNVFVHECHVCQAKLKFIEGVSTLDTHHINHQKDCIDGFVLNKEHLKKNSSANLVVLCKSCHNKVHDGSLKIDGYMLTSSGKKLKVAIEDKKKK